MRKLNVIYNGWGERFILAVLADDGKDLLFEYTPEAIESNLQLSPFKLPLSTKAYGYFPEHLLRLPGIISDALPDGWGMLLMDRLFRKTGRNPNQISPLDRLAFIGDKAMGALTFEPAESETLTPEDIKLLDLAQEVQDVFEDESEELLRKLAILGGSPQGVRPKVLVNFDLKKNRMTNSSVINGIPMLIKFPAAHEHKEVCAIEAMYGKIAAACGIRIPNMQYFDLSKDLSAFGIERFDRIENMRVPMHTAAGAAHVDFRYPQLDYVALLRLTQFITRDTREVLQAFERCVFNVVFNNRDDHSKNFSFLLDKNGYWKFSPAYDLVFSAGPRGEHQMDICGEALAPTRENLLQLASKTGIAKKDAIKSIERIHTVAERFSEFAENFPIRKATIKSIEKAIMLNCGRLK